MGKYKKLISNSLVFTIGNFGSKFISFFMVPLYTNYLSTNEYGIIDLIMTTINLMLPLTTLEMGQAILRFAIDSNLQKDKNKYYSTSLLFILCISLIVLLCGPFVVNYTVFKEFSYQFSILLALFIFNNFFQNLVRGLGFSKEFAVNGILTTFAIVTLNIFFLVNLKLGMNGYLISLIISYMISNVYLVHMSRRITKFSFSQFSKNNFNEMVKYSIPLMPNGIMWWLINGSTRYFILYFLGSSVNGLYAVATKIPNIVTTVTTVFMQAWQLSSFEEFDSKDKDIFYSNIFDILSLIMFLFVSLILVILIPLFKVAISSEYFDSWVIVPPLLMGVIYQSLSSFLGTNYTAAKKTAGAFTTSVFGGVVSLIANFIFIKLFGVYAVGFGTLVSFLTMFIMRFYDTQKYVKINLNLLLFFGNNVLLVIQIVLLFYVNGITLYIFQLMLFFALLLLNSKLIKSFFSLAVNFIKKRKL